MLASASLLFAAHAPAASLLEQARINTGKRAGTECDRTSNCVRAGVRSCERTKPGKVACRAFLQARYGIDPDDDVFFHARFAWERQDGEVVLVNDPKWR